jgi:acetyl-CoA acetyltransferase family protein
MDAYLLDAVRTPFGRFRGGLSGVRTDDLAATTITELLARHPDIDLAQIDDVVLGNANGAGEDNRNVGRMAALLSGLPVGVPGVTVNRLCASGAEAIVQAARAVGVGDHQLVVAGGVEGMSRSPYVVPKPDEALPRKMEMVATTVGWRLVNPKFPAQWTQSLGACAERVAAELGIGRAEQDAWALRSHELAAEAWEKGLHDDYVRPVADVTRDESVRSDTSLAKLASLAPAFSADGTVTAGNSSPLNDGAIACLVGSALAAGELGISPLAKILASATVAVTPERFTLAPVPAVAKALTRLGMTVEDVDVWEVNEAFAAMVLSTLDGLSALGRIDPTKVNVHGGAIAIGHPLGASAPRVIVDLCRELRRRGGGIGVAAACVGVGQGTALVVRVEG